MPLPAYVILSDSGSVDQLTHRVSIFNIVEAFNVALQEELVSAAPNSQPQPNAGIETNAPATGIERRIPITTKTRIVTAWMKEEGDTPQDNFDLQVACIAPDGSEFFYTQVTTFAFTLWFHRLNVEAPPIPGFPQLGVYRLESRLRRTGQQEWQWRQSFPFVVQETQPTYPAAAPAIE
jgi:hypothetical protein